MDVILIKVSEKPTKINITSFEQAKQIVCDKFYSSPAEIVPLSNNSFIFLDEEGKLKNLPVNAVATSLAHLNESILPSDYIVGDVIVVYDVNEFDNLPYHE